MASTIGTNTVGTKRNRSLTPPLMPFALGVICLVGGALLAMAVIERFARFGSDVSHLLALDAPMRSEVGQVLGPAGGSVDNLLFVGSLVWLAVAGSLLLVGAGMWLTSARTRHPDAARRVSAFGLWLALGVSLMALIPLHGTWRDAGLGGAASWGDDAIRVMVLSILGILILQLSAPQWRSSVKQAFKE